MSYGPLLAAPSTGRAIWTGIGIGPGRAGKGLERRGRALFVSPILPYLDAMASS